MVMFGPETDFASGYSCYLWARKTVGLMFWAAPRNLSSQAEDVALGREEPNPKPFNRPVNLSPPHPPTHPPT